MRARSLVLAVHRAENNYRAGSANCRHFRRGEMGCSLNLYPDDLLHITFGGSKVNEDLIVGECCRTLAADERVRAGAAGEQVQLSVLHTVVEGVVACGAEEHVETISAADE